MFPFISVFRQAKPDLLKLYSQVAQGQMVCGEKHAKNSSSKSAARMGKNWLRAPVERAAESMTAAASHERRAKTIDAARGTASALMFGNALLHGTLRWSNVARY
jgi:hypothetical protein